MNAKNDKPAAAEASTADERVGYRRPPIVTRSGQVSPAIRAAGPKARAV